MAHVFFKMASLPAHSPNAARPSWTFTSTSSLTHQPIHKNPPLKGLLPELVLPLLSGAGTTALGDGRGVKLLQRGRVFVRITELGQFSATVGIIVLDVRDIVIIIVLINHPPPFIFSHPFPLTVAAPDSHIFLPAVVVVALLVHDEAVDDPVLYSVHAKGEDEHGEGDLQRLVSFGPPERPVSHPGEPGEGQEEEEDEEFHECEPDAVDEELLEIPGDAGWVPVIAGLDRLRRVGEGRAEEDGVEEFEEDIKNGDAESGL
jgi:hypothetical protein